MRASGLRFVLCVPPERASLRTSARWHGCVLCFACLRRELLCVPAGCVLCFACLRRELLCVPARAGTAAFCVLIVYINVTVVVVVA